MSNHPLNLLVRFVLELSGLVALGYWGWTQHDAPWRVVWGAGLPLAAGALWGIFRVPNDPGPAPMPVPGALRLALELAYFAGAVTLLAAAGQLTMAAVFGGVVAFHYAVSYDRIAWLLGQ